MADADNHSLRLCAGLLLALLGLAGCGGGEGTDTPPVAQETSERELAQICSVDNPYQVHAQGTVKPGSLSDEKKWIHAYMDQRYLWYQDIRPLDPDAPEYTQFDANGQLQVGRSLVSYFNDLRTPRLTPSGARVDKFSFVIDTKSWNDFSASQSLGFGWLLRRQADGLKVAYVYPVARTGLAFDQGVQRGDRVVSVNGVMLDQLSSDQWNQAFNPETPAVYVFGLERDGQHRSVVLQAQNVSLPQAQYSIVETDGVRWGYLVFNSHVSSAEPVLLQAIRAFQRSGATELVLDLRYNGGGYLAIASALATAIAGDARTQGRVFEQTRFNDKRSAQNFSMGFYGTTLFSGQSYARLDLSRLYVLTSAETCSASESLINGLRGVDVEVVQIGETTCGKPYGFYPQDNCGLTYAAMEFEGVNDKGEGGFSDGIAPQCVVRDDLNYALFDPREPLFATAIAHRKGLACVTPAARGVLGSAAAVGQDVKTGPLLRPDWQRNKYIQIR